MLNTLLFVSWQSLAWYCKAGMRRVLDYQTRCAGREVVSSNWIWDSQDRDTSFNKAILILASSILYSGTFGTCNLKDPENPPVILLMSVSEQKKDALHKTEISNSAFTDGLDAPHHCAKHQFSCTRGEGFAIVEAMCICDCTQSCEEVKDDLYDDYQGVHQGRKRYSRCVVGNIKFFDGLYSHTLLSTLYNICPCPI